MAPFWRFSAVLHTVVFTLFFLVGAHAAVAITAQDVMGKMDERQRFGYLSGLVDMLAYQAALAGNGERANCITDSYYRGGKDKAWPRLYAALEKFGDKRPESIVVLLARKACGG